MSTARSSKDQRYVFPAVCSMLLPGLGQVMKQQIKWAAFIWLWLLLGNLLLLLLSGILGWLSIVLMLLYTLLLWVYQLYDAYTSQDA